MTTTTAQRAAATTILSATQQRSIVDARKAKLALWTGAVSSGKTIASLIAFLDGVARAPDRGLIVIVGRTLQTIERNILDPLMSTELFGPLSAHIHHTRGSSTVTILGRTAHLIGASDVRSEGRIRGATVALAYVDEVTLLPQGFWMMLLSRLRVPGARLLATTNPDGPTHWLRKDFILRADQVNMQVFQFRLADNPSLTDEYLRDIYATYTGLWRRRFIDGHWCIAEGAVYDMFDEARHVIRGPLPQMIAWPGVGVDYGTANAFSAHLIGVQPGDGAHPTRLVVAREYRHDPRAAFKQKTDAEFSADLRAWINPDRPEWVAVDPSAASFRVQLFRDGVTNVVNADNAVLDGVRQVGSLLAADRLVIHESCRGLLDELPGYSWDPAAAARGQDKPIKVDDHGCDSARYGIVTTQIAWRKHLPVTHLAPAHTR